MQVGVSKELFRFGYELVGTEIFLRIFMSKRSRDRWVSKGSGRYEAYRKAMSKEDEKEIMEFFYKLTGDIS